ncbi:MAG: sugar phosphate isomerase/epimerase family protein [Rariglobus sp.]|nr:TIM barrel protein [Rariglobus sp.]
MKLLFAKSKWEAPQLSLDAFLDRVVADRFDGSELYLGGQPETAALIRTAHSDRGLFCIAQVLTGGDTPAAHRETLVRQLDLAFETGVRLINVHVGSDVFEFSDNVALIAESQTRARAAGIPLCVETHRGRPTFSGPETVRLLKALPDLRLTADFSHWMCVHESTLENQPANLAHAQAHSDHLHARIGFPQGPQVGHPLAPEWASLRERYLELWRPIISRHRSEGREWFTITPEAGPPPYMPVLPFSGQPVADAWQVNVAMRDWLLGLNL